MALKFRVRISHRIAAIGAIGVFGLLAMGGLYLVGDASLARYREIAGKGEASYRLTSKILADMLEARRNEKDFLLQADEKFVGASLGITKRIASDLVELSAQLTAVGRTDLDQALQKIRGGMNIYSNSFAAVVEGRRSQGLTPNEGLEGRLRSAVHDIESSIKDAHEDALMAPMLTLRRHEKDFMLRRDQNYVKEFDASIAKFGSSLASSALSSALQLEIANKLSKYQDSFHSWANQATAVAVEQKRLSEAFAAIEPQIKILQVEVNRTLAEADAGSASAQAETKWYLSLSILVLAILAGALAFLCGRSVVVPLRTLTKAMNELARGNFDVSLPGLKRIDEIGEIAAAVDEFKLKAVEKAKSEAYEEEERSRASAADRRLLMNDLADRFEATVGGIVSIVSSASTELSTSAQMLNATAEETSNQAMAVAAASEEATNNVNTVAAATEELASSVRQINERVANSARMASEAVKEAANTGETVQELSAGTQKIGDIVSLISNVAAQTNLLALNATIEAARAGDAGRGFAVVAQEVKLLAEQSAKAADQISSEIGSIQGSTKATVSAIASIAAIIEKMHENASIISVSVEEQAATTQEIARNVQRASSGTLEVSSNITGVTKVAEETSFAASQVLGSSNELSVQSELLRSEVKKFLMTVRAA